MGLVLVTTLALAAWIVLWATGQKAIDGFILTSVVILLGAGGRMLIPHLPGRE